MPTLCVVRDQAPRSTPTELPLIEGEVLLDQLLRNGVPLAHDCEGTLACASCLVVVRTGLDTLTPANEDEQDILDRAESGPGSRLACQVVGGDGDLVVEIPNDRAVRMVMPLSGTAAPIAVSERAVEHFAVQLGKHPVAVAVRLSVHPAGCSGLRYQVSYADAIEADDLVFQSGRISIAVAPSSLPFLQGTRLDLVNEGLARRLSFDNPNVRQTCGCGESFGT